MTKRFRFFATPEDLRKALKELEGLVDIKYVLMDLYKSEQIKEYMSCEEIDTLGYSSKGNQGSDSYLVMFKEGKCVIDAVKQEKDGSYHYFVKQFYNQDSVDFSTGGIISRQISHCR